MIFEASGLLAGATIGAGIFALPYLFKEAGWLTGLLYVGVLSTLIIFSHIIFARVLLRIGNHHHLVGLAQTYLGRWGFRVASMTVFAGLLLTLVAYLALAAQFLANIFSLPAPFSIFLFWLIVSLPLFFKSRSVAGAESYGTIVKIVIIVGLAFISPGILNIARLPAVQLDHIALPFGPILFALGGWTAIPAMIDLQKRHSAKGLFPAIALGTIISALLYILFALAILGFNPNVSSDIASSMKTMPYPLNIALILLGLLGLWTVYVSISLEVKSSFERDLKLKPKTSMIAAACLPVILVMFGFRDFLTLAGLVGGIFLSAQYALILLIARRALQEHGIQKFLVYLVLCIFLLTTLYEISAFIVK